jgi:hypothetical protein
VHSNPAYVVLERVKLILDRFVEDAYVNRLKALSDQNVDVGLDCFDADGCTICVM